MPSINTLVDSFSTQNISYFFENKIASFKPEKEIFENYVGEETQYSNPVKIGHAEFKNHEELLVFSCEYNKELTARSAKKQQFEIAKKVLKEDFKDGAIFIFHDSHNNFRFSFIRRNWEEKADKKYTSWKRYTYQIHPNETNKTFKERINNCSFNDLDAIQEAFSVEKLTKEFYNELFTWYQWALSDEIGITFPHNTEITEDDRSRLEEQVIRLITRLLFVWFIKQKKLVPEELFETDELSKILKDFDSNSISDGNYYNAILQNLFFATLNKEINEREFAKLKNRDVKTRFRYKEIFNLSEQEVLELFKPIPFLNGGLFECLDKEDVDGNKYFLDGFSRNSTKAANGNFRHRAFIPNCVFFDKEKGIIPLLKRYNFTVEENAPNEVQVALDPELLGKVFENLLGAFNPETKETARKQSGSFYTPREIVDYMVNESLITYLQNDFPDLEEKIVRGLFEEEKLPNDLIKNHTLCELLSKKLRTIKILDPACGSGAFPMGILNKMVKVLEKLDCKNEESIHDLKLHLIEECIYGIDIQNIATQISKLRFFISLVVEQGEKDLSKPDENYGVLTLPNLETKFVSANTLIGIKKKKEGEFVNTLFTDPEIEITKQELLKIRREHFYAKTAGAKKRLRELDAELRAKLTKLLQENNEFAPEDAVQFSKWNPYDQNTSSPFFDTEWMFGLEQGFDVVIGNPPYVQLQKDSGKLASLYKDGDFKTFAKTGDIYSLFYEKGWQLLKNKGSLCYITSNKWMRAGYGKSTRQFFAENTNPILLIDFAGQKIFESATVDTNILLFSKDKNRRQTKACIVKDKVLNNLSVFVRQECNECTFLGSESWVILNQIEQNIKAKIEAVGTPLKDWEINIYRGILTGYNNAFIIDGEKKNELIAEDPKSAEIIRPILRGRDIKRYSYKFADIYLIATFPSLKINIDQYPAVKQHLLSFGKERLEQTGKKYIVNGQEIKARKKTNNKWFETQDSINYWDDFNRQKIIYPNMTKFLPFVYDDNGFLTNQKCFIVTGKYVEFLTAFFNSSLFKFCFRDNFPELLGGTRELSKIFFDKIPVIQIENETNNSFKNLIQKLQEAIIKQQPTKEIELEIDDNIFNLYSLTTKERKEIGFIEIQ